MKYNSIEWLIRELDLDNDGPTMKAINKARAMHKEEIMDAFDKGCDIGCDIGSNYNYHDGHNQGYDYYNETFNTKEK
jgi:hypothetical protein